MAALAKGKQKPSKLSEVIKGTLGEAFGAFLSMVNFTEEGDVQEAIESAKRECINPKEAQDLDKLKQITDLTEKDLEQKAKAHFQISETEKDEDSYNKIPNQLNIEATVSEEAAQKAMQTRKKGGKQKTIVDED